jgi:nuclear protein localization family protein 4
MLLRFRGPDGTVRITVEPHDTFGKLGEKVYGHYRCNMIHANSLQLLNVLPETVDFNTLTLSNAPAGGEVKLLKEIASFPVAKIGLK